MHSDLTLLVSSAGRRVALIDCFRADAAALGVSLRVIGIDVRPEESAACMRADVAYKVPRCTDPDFVPYVHDLVAREGVNLIVPTIDTELPIYAAAAEAFLAAGVAVSVSNSPTVEIACDKKLTAEVFHAAGVGVPRTMLLSSFHLDRSDWRWPLMLKPIGGSSSIGIRRVCSRSDLDGLEEDGDRFVVQELWDGVEYTVNIFFDRSGVLRSAVPHRRIEVRAGEVSKGRTERVSSLRDAADRIASALPGSRGALCFQAIVAPTGEVAVFEINARFGGGYPLAHAAGATFSRWLLEEAAGIESSASDEWQEGMGMLRYDAAVFCE